VSTGTTLWSQHDAAWRHPAQIASHWHEAGNVDRRLLRCSVRGAWWETLAASGVTLLVTREYEHLVMALRADRRGPAISYMPFPHPSGLAIDGARRTVYLASTRNPNQIYDLAPVTAMIPRRDVPPAPAKGRPLVPVRSRLFPGCLYMHDLAVIGGELYVTAVGQNSILRLDAAGRHQLVWWPRCIDSPSGPIVDRNHIQLNSIAAGTEIGASYFSASAAAISGRRPGQRNFPVDRRGVVFSGVTREPIVTGLTRPHSARLHRGRLWVENSGYGEVGVVTGGRFVPVIRLAGWTRGLCFHRHIAFIGTSRVIPKFRHYAPGLDLNDSLCGLHAVDTRSGRILGSLIWPDGNQIFALECVPHEFTTGFPFTVGERRVRRRATALFYAFTTSAGERE
jgi:uncharacterized protein (TIGR03032 family)